MGYGSEQGSRVAEALGTADLDRRLPRLPELWERLILERDVILIDRRTNRILDIVENVIALATDR